MKRVVGAMAALTLSLGVTACGDDEPEIEATPTTETPAEDVFDFDTLDANGDSYLDIDEIAEGADVDGIFDSWDADVDSELDSDEIAGNAFELWDADGNGTVSETEWEDATARWYPEDEEVTVFADWDGDGDSELDADEFTESFDLSPLGEMWTDLDKETFKQSYFALYDADEDGKVTEAEFMSGAALFGSPEE